MNKKLYHFFAEDHHRIEGLLEKATGDPNQIELELYQQFRSGLLRHIKMEEKTLFPASRKVDERVMSELIPRFKLEHGALTALMVPPPTADLLKVIKHVLEKHDYAEERPGGLYDVCEALTHDQTQELLEQLKNTPEVPTHGFNSAPIAIESARRALLRANYDFDEIIRGCN